MSYADATAFAASLATTLMEREYDHLSSDEAVDETIAANEYTFTEAGRRFG